MAELENRRKTKDCLDVAIELWSQKKLLIILPLAISIVTITAPAASGQYAITVFVLDGSNPTALMQSAFYCGSIGGSWSNSTVTCTINDGTAYQGTFTIDKGAALLINISRIGWTFNNAGAMTNYGSLRIVNGSFTGGEIYNENGSIFSNSGSISSDEIYSDNGGTIINSGSISAFYFIRIGPHSMLNNSVGGKITDSRDRIIYNYGTLYNAGKITNDGYIISNATLTNTGVITNNGTINNSRGKISNGGTITDLCGGTIYNSGQISGNPVITTSSCAVTSTATVPEFPIGSIAVLAFVTIAIVASLAKRGRRIS